MICFFRRRYASFISTLYKYVVALAGKALAAKTCLEECDRALSKQGLVLDAVSSLTSYLRKATSLRSKSGSKSLFAHQNNAVRCELHKNGVRGHVRRTLIRQQGWRLESWRVKSAESRGGRLGTRLYRAAPCLRKRVAQLARRHNQK